MNKLIKFIPKSVVLTASRQILKAKKNSPHIFFVAGVGGTVLSTVLACRATLKLSETLDDIKHDVEAAKPAPVSPADEFMDERDYHRDMVYVYGKASLKLVKLYGVPILIGAASVGALTGSHVQLVRRNTALMAAYAAVQKAYDDYRDRVRDKLGEEAELDIYHGARTELVKNKDGEIEQGKVVDPNKYSAYAKFFDEYSRFWNKDPELNRIFVQVQQNYANHRLNAYGHVFLNEVYDALGIDRSTPGAVVGWVKNGDGDGYIDFGIFEAFNSAFVNGWERSILLDFNVDGVIYDKI
ncbi:MAG: DUF6353 family protein [Paenisporosarcina sp.]